MLTFRPRIRRSPKTYWLFENALQSGNFWKLHWSNIERKKSIIVITIPVLKKKRHYLWMGETIRKRLVCTRIFLKTEKIYMLFQTTRIRVNMASHGTCCELYFSAKQRDLNGNRSYKEPLRQSPALISPFDVWQRFLFLGGLSSWSCITNAQGEKSWCSPAWSIKTFSLLMTRGNKLFKRSAFNLTFLLSFPLSFVNRTHSSYCVSIIYIHCLGLFRRDCLFYHLLLACGFNETFTLVALILCTIFTKKKSSKTKKLIIFQSCGRSKSCSDFNKGSKPKQKLKR